MLALAPMAMTVTAGEEPNILCLLQAEPESVRSLDPATNLQEMRRTQNWKQSRFRSMSEWINKSGRPMQWITAEQ